MKCPYCGAEMQEGWLQSTRPFFWGQEQTERFLVKPQKKKGEFYVSEGFWEGSFAPADYCEACKKLILSVNTEE